MTENRRAATVQPLDGWRVLVPRPTGRGDELLRLLRHAGAQPVPVPLIETRPESGTTDMQRAASDLAAGTVNWVAFTSAAAVTAMLDAARHAGLDRCVGDGTRVAAVGDATAAALRAAGIAVHLIPEAPGSAAALVSAWPHEPAGRSVLLPRSDRARPELPDALRKAGYRVREVIAYRTVTVPVPAGLARDLAAGQIDAVLLTSPSIAAALATVPVARGTVVVAIGPSTATAACDLGLPVTATAAEPSSSGLVDALVGVTVTGTRA